MARRWMRPGIVRWLSGLLASVLMVAAVSGLLQLVKPYVPPLHLLVLYVPVVLVVAIVWGTGLAAVSAVLSVAVFNYLLADPATRWRVRAGGAPSRWASSWSRRWSWESWRPGCSARRRNRLGCRGSRPRCGGWRDTYRPGSTARRDIHGGRQGGRPAVRCRIQRSGPVRPGWHQYGGRILEQDRRHWCL
jgi:hypothetical protein